MIDEDISGVELQSYTTATSGSDTNDSENEWKSLNSNEVANKSTPKRATWDNKVQFLLSQIGFAVGTGNVWRFPYLCEKYGGGAFLIPYFTMLIIEGIPLYYLEMSIGYQTGRGPTGTWFRTAPVLGGIGIAELILCFIVSLYYVVTMVWSFFYMFNSFHATLPWSKCDYAADLQAAFNASRNLTDVCRNDSAQFYWYNRAVRASSSISEPGEMDWRFSLILLLSWGIVYLCVIKGIKSSGKVLYFSAIFPYVILFAMLFRGVTLEGAGDGLALLFTPNWKLLYDPHVWLVAAAQIYYSTGLAFGSLIMFASYYDPPDKTKGRVNLFRDTLIVVLTNCATSLLAAITVFSILGYKSRQTQLHPSEIASGPALAFILFSDALSLMPGAPFWSVVFFLMLIFLALDSQFATIETVITDAFDALGVKYSWCKKPVISGSICLAGLLLGLIFCTQSGYYTFQLFDTFSANWSLVLIGFLEFVAVSWVYGVDRFAQGISKAEGKYPRRMWLIMWKYISPLSVALLLIGSLIMLAFQPITYTTYENFEKKDDAEFPGWALFCGAFLTLVSIAPVAIVAIRHFVRRSTSFGPASADAN